MKFFQCIRGSASYRDMQARSTPIGINSVSMIDRASRVLFPLSFLIFNIFYWSLYLRNDHEHAIYL